MYNENAGCIIESYLLHVLLIKHNGHQANI